MQSLRKHNKPIAVAAAAAFLAVSGPLPVAKAALISTEGVTTAESAEARAQIMQFLSRDDVRQQMESLGVSPQEAEARIAALSDAEVAEIQGRLDSVPAGEGFWGTVIGAGVVIFLVLLLTDILGFTNAFGFTNKGSAR